MKEFLANNFLYILSISFISNRCAFLQEKKSAAYFIISSTLTSKNYAVNSLLKLCLLVMSFSLIIYLCIIEIKCSFASAVRRTLLRSCELYVYLYHQNYAQYSSCILLNVQISARLWLPVSIHSF